MPQKPCPKCGHVTLYISWSALKTHIECHQKNFLKKSGKANKLSDQRIFFPGTVTDRVVRDWLENDPYNNLGKMPSMVEETIIREKGILEAEGGVMKWKDAHDYGQTILDCQEAVRNLEPILVEKVLPYEYQADFHFKIPVLLPHPDGSMESIILNGAIDILVFDPVTQTWRIYDVKHTRSNDYWRKTQGQLGFYDFAIFAGFGQYSSEVALLQPLAAPQFKEISLDSRTRSVMMTAIMRMATEVWSEDRAPRIDNKLCNYCEVKHACAKFKPTIINGKRKLSFS
jgi:hypothetical protein